MRYRTSYGTVDGAGALVLKQGPYGSGRVMMHRRLIFLPSVALAVLLAAVPGTGAERPIPTHVNVLVVGGSPAGIAAAVAAARAGMTTLLVEPREEIGGDMTLAWLNMMDLNRGPDGLPLTRGIFAQVHKKLGQTYDIKAARKVFADLVGAQRTLTVLTHTTVRSPHLSDGTLTGLVLTAGGRTQRVTADQFIDATDDASLAVASGVPYRIGREETGLDRRQQAATLIFHLKGVDYEIIRRYIAAFEKPGHIGGVNGRYIWGFSRIAWRYVPHNPRMGLYDLNLGWQTDGTVLVNALQIYDVDGTNATSMNEAHAQALKELPSVVRFLQTSIPGFAQATLVDAAPRLYIRETRHIDGLYRMTPEDIRDSHDFPDRIAVASYPIDLHPYGKGQMNPYRVSRRVYAIPFRILVPQRIDHLMVVGKPVSAGYAAAGSLRMIPTGMSMGEAAGEAAVLAISSATTPTRIATSPALIAQLQRRLLAAGVYLASPQHVLATAKKP